MLRPMLKRCRRLAPALLLILAIGTGPTRSRASAAETGACPTVQELLGSILLGQNNNRATFHQKIAAFLDEVRSYQGEVVVEDSWSTFRLSPTGRPVIVVRPVDPWSHSKDLLRAFEDWKREFAGFVDEVEKAGGRVIGHAGESAFKLDPLGKPQIYLAEKQPWTRRAEMQKLFEKWKSDMTAFFSEVEANGGAVFVVRGKRYRTLTPDGRPEIGLNTDLPWSRHEVDVEFLNRWKTEMKPLLEKVESHGGKIVVGPGKRGFSLSADGRPVVHLDSDFIWKGLDEYKRDVARWESEYAGLISEVESAGGRVTARPGRAEFKVIAGGLPEIGIPSKNPWSAAAKLREEFEAWKTPQLAYVKELEQKGVKIVTRPRGGAFEPAGDGAPIVALDSIHPLNGRDQILADWRRYQDELLPLLESVREAGGTVIVGGGKSHLAVGADARPVLRLNAVNPWQRIEALAAELERYKADRLSRPDRVLNSLRHGLFSKGHVRLTHAKKLAGMQDLLKTVSSAPSTAVSKESLLRLEKTMKEVIRDAVETLETRRREAATVVQGLGPREAALKIRLKSLASVPPKDPVVVARELGLPQIGSLRDFYEYHFEGAFSEIGSAADPWNSRLKPLGGEAVLSEGPSRLTLDANGRLLALVDRDQPWSQFSLALAKAREWTDQAVPLIEEFRASGGRIEVIEGPTRLFRDEHGRLVLSIQRDQPLREDGLKSLSKQLGLVASEQKLSGILPGFVDRIASLQVATAQRLAAEGLDFYSPGYLQELLYPSLSRIEALHRMVDVGGTRPMQARLEQALEKSLSAVIDTGLEVMRQQDQLLERYAAAAGWPPAQKERWLRKRKLDPRQRLLQELGLQPNSRLRVLLDAHFPR